MFELISTDMMEVFGRIPGGLVPGLAAVILVLLMEKIFRREFHILAACLTGCFVVYLYVIVQTAFFSREPGSRVGGIDLRILPGWRNNIFVCVYAVENIFMFFPFGMILPALWKPCRRLSVCILLAALFSAGIEAAQYVTGRGYCQAEDVLMNALGAAAGYGIFLLLRLAKNILSGRKVKL